MLFMRIIRFTSAVSCGILRPSQRAFGTYLCVYREEDDHTTPDRKSSGLDDPVRHVVAADRVPQPLSGRGRQILSFPSSCRPGQKVRRCEWSRSDALLYALFCIFFCLSAGDIHFRRISPIYIHPFLYTTPSPHPVIFSTYFLPQHRCFHRFFLHRSAGPPSSPPPYSQRPRSSFASYVPSLVPLYLQLPSPRPLSGIYAASESLPFERSFLPFVLFRQRPASARGSRLYTMFNV